MNTEHPELLCLTTDYCFSRPSPIVANTDKDSTKSSAYNIGDIHYSLKGTELFIIPNVQALNIPYSFTVLTRYSLFVIPLPLLLLLLLLLLSLLLFLLLLYFIIIIIIWF